MKLTDHIKGRVAFRCCFVPENQGAYYPEHAGAVFQYYRKGELWYKTPEGNMREVYVGETAVLWYETDTGINFEVPCNDTGEADFHQADKAMLFMRWIKKALKD